MGAFHCLIVIDLIGTGWGSWSGKVGWKWEENSCSFRLRPILFEPFNQPGEERCVRSSEHLGFFCQRKGRTFGRTYAAMLDSRWFGFMFLLMHSRCSTLFFSPVQGGLLFCLFCCAFFCGGTPNQWIAVKLGKSTKISFSIRVLRFVHDVSASISRLATVEQHTLVATYRLQEP